MLNHVVLMGRLTKNPELKHTQSGVPVVSFSLAVERNYRADGGERATDFIDCVAWRATAEFLFKYFVKGQLAAVDGCLQVRGWTDKDGNKRRSTEVIVDSVYFTGDKRGKATQEQDTGQEFKEIEDDGELPF